MGFPRQEYWSRLPLPSPGALPDPGTEPMSPALQADSFTTEPVGKSLICESECKTFSDGQTHNLFCELICSVKYCEPVASLSLFTNFVSLVSDPSWAGSAVQQPVEMQFPHP